MIVARPPRRAARSRPSSPRGSLVAVLLAAASAARAAATEPSPRIGHRGRRCGPCRPRPRAPRPGRRCGGTGAVVVEELDHGDVAVGVARDRRVRVALEPVARRAERLRARAWPRRRRGAAGCRRPRSRSRGSRGSCRARARGPAPRSGPARRRAGRGRSRGLWRRRAWRSPAGSVRSSGTVPGGRAGRKRARSRSRQGVGRHLAGRGRVGLGTGAMRALLLLVPPPRPRRPFVAADSPSRRATR